MLKIILVGYGAAVVWLFGTILAALALSARANRAQRRGLAGSFSGRPRVAGPSQVELGAPSRRFFGRKNRRAHGLGGLLKVCRGVEEV